MEYELILVGFRKGWRDRCACELDGGTCGRCINDYIDVLPMIIDSRSAIDIYIISMIFESVYLNY